MTGIILGTLSLIVLSLRIEGGLAQPTPPILKPVPVETVKAKPDVVEGEVLVRYKEKAIENAPGLGLFSTVLSIFKTTGPSERTEKILYLGNALQKKFPATVLATHSNMGVQRLKLPPGVPLQTALKTLQSFSEIEFAEPNYKIFPLFANPPGDKYWVNGPHSLWGMNRIGMKQAWNETGIADNIIIAVTDTGIDFGHPDLRDNMWKNPGEFGKTQYEDDDLNGIVDDVYGVNYCWWNAPGTHPTGNPDDKNSHGTGVAGVIGAVVDNPGTNEGYVAGVHRKAKLMALKVICYPELGDPEDSKVSSAAAAIRYAVDKGASVINASWYVATGTDKISPITGAANGSGVLREAIEAARAKNVLFVAAAGNSADQRDNDSISIYPANYGNPVDVNYLDNVIAVAATWDICSNGEPVNSNNGNCDNGSTPRETLWEHSHYGNNAVPIAAPGWFTYTLMPTSLDSQGFTVFGGTSMASPHVAGCAALLQAQRAANPALSPYSAKDLKETLLNKADLVAGIDLVGGIFSFNVTNGNGRRLNCDKALPRNTSPPAAPTGLIVR
jgi:subtilisin family serine protease